MEKIKALAVVLVTLSAIFELLTALLPSKKFKTLFNIIVSCAALLLVFSAFKDISWSDFYLSEEAKESAVESSLGVERRIDDYIVHAGESELAEFLKKNLNEKEIFPEKIEVTMDRNEDKSIYIREIGITLSKDQKYLKNAVKTIAENVLENEIEVRVT